MKALPKAVATSVLVVFGTLASSSAMADYYGHGFGHRHGHGRHGHGGDIRFGISLGFPVYAPGFFPTPYYVRPARVYAYPPVVIESSAPPVYVERSAAPASAPAQADWYYCAESKAYYPYVAECASGWQRVPAQPANQ